MGKLQDATQDLLWSLWSELGIPGRKRLHQSVATDPEPLVVWTPLLAAREPRLLGLAFDWCSAHAATIVKTRFPGLARNMPGNAVAAFAGFSGALTREGVDWQPRGTPTDLERGRTKMALPTERPALVRFRLRGLCGASARAEVMAMLLASGMRAGRAADLIPPGFTRRSVERVLDDLVGANLVTVDGGERHRVFRLRERGALETLVHAGGLRWVDWHRALSLAASLLDVASHAFEGPSIARVEAARVWAALSRLGSSLGLQPPGGTSDRPDVFEALLEWGTGAIATF